MEVFPGAIPESAAPGPPWEVFPGSLIESAAPEPPREVSPGVTPERAAPGTHAAWLQISGAAGLHSPEQVNCNCPDARVL